MFEDYIQDAYFFYELANRKAEEGLEREAMMCYRASVFCAASSMEAFINFIGDTFKKGNNLDKNEIAFLNDKVIEVVPAKGLFEERVRYQSIEGKLKYVVKRFKVGIDFATSNEWQQFIHFKDLRDSLVHPKSISDENTAAGYREFIKKGLNSNIDIMNMVSLQLF